MELFLLFRDLETIWFSLSFRIHCVVHLLIVLGDDNNLSDILNDIETINHNLRAIRALDFTQSDHESEAEMDQR